MSISINSITNSSKKSNSILDNMPGLISTTAGIEEVEEERFESHYKGFEERSKGERAVVVFSCQLSEQTEVSYTTLLKDTTLYIQIPPAQEACFSKEAFVTLLEYAEERLHCHHIIVCLRKDRPDRPQLVKMFNFLGFCVLAPNSPLVPPTDALNLYMLYRVEQ